MGSTPYNFIRESEASRSAYEDTPRKTVSVVSQISQPLHEIEEEEEEIVSRSDAEHHSRDSQPESSPRTGYLKSLQDRGVDNNRIETTQRVKTDYNN